MNDILADTHAALWHVLAPGQLSATAFAAMQNATQAGGTVYCSTITLVEIRYLIEKRKLPSSSWNSLWAALQDPAILLNTLDVTPAIAEALARIPRATVPDMPDRIIAATALFHGLPLVTCDAKIRALSNITTVW